MDLRDDIPTNLTDLTDQLRQIANREQPAPAVWDEIRQRLDDCAMFLETFVTPRIPPPMRYLTLEKFEPPLAVVRQSPELIAAVAGANGDHALRPATDSLDDETDARLSDSR